MIEDNWVKAFARERAVVAPSLLAADFANLERELRALEEGGVKIVHVDVMDGRLVPNISVGVPVVAAIRKVTRLKLDAHLMIVDPERFIEPFVDAGVDSLTIHIEAAPNPTPILRKIRSLGVAPGLAVNYGTSVEKALPFVGEADLLLTMSVPAGFGGQRFHEDSLETVRAFRRVVSDDVLLEIDGGIDETTIGAASEAGVNLFVAGTGVFRSNDYGARASLLKRLALDAKTRG